jgi:uncharacterized protein YjeT (DUF2065 family)
LKRLSQTEWFALGLAFLFVIVGGFSVISPKATLMVIPASGGPYRTETITQNLSKDEVRISGAVSILVGLALASFVLYRGRK